MYSTKIIHHECKCMFSNGIEDKNCIKRSYVLSDYKNNRYVKIYYCNEYLRLKVAEWKDKHDYFNFNYFFENIIKEYVEPYNTCYYGYKERNLIDIRISATLCDSPKIITYIPILDAIDIIRLNYWTIDALAERIFQRVNCYLETNVRSKASKSKYTELIRLSNRIVREYSTEKKNLYINELFINILELKTK